jgi:hypothetical protein
MKRILFISIVCLCTTVSCNSIPKKIKNAYTFCYLDTYTGIDTLINITGYYSNPENSNQRIIFYNNRLVVSRFSDYNKERWKNDEPKNISLFLKEVADNPNTKDAIFYYDIIDCGSYIVSGDTIKVQMLHKYHSLNDNWFGKERWYKIIDRNTLLCIKGFELTSDKREKAFIEKNYRLDVGDYSTFIPAEATPPSNYYWILREKWFWCNEQDWQNYVTKIKQKKK